MKNDQRSTAMQKRKPYEFCVVSNEEQMDLILSSDKGFYIGDPLFMLSKVTFRSTFLNAPEYKTAIICAGHAPISLPGQGMAVCWAFAGKGIYFDDEDTLYPVDSGIIALIPLELVEQEFADLGTLCVFPGRAYLRYDCGVITVLLPDETKVSIDSTDVMEEEKI